MRASGQRVNSMAVNIKDNRSDFDKFIKGLAAVSAGPKSVTAGVQQGTRTPEGIDVAGYAAVNEFGAVIRRKETDKGPVRGTVIPSRPFMRFYFDRNESYLARFAENAITQAMLGRATPKMAFSAIGVKMQDGIKKQIKKSEDYVPNSVRTIKEKGSDRPLIDHAILLSNIQFQINRD